MLDSERLLQHPQEALKEIAHPGKIAIYDMDRTITVRGTYADFLRFMVMRLAPWRMVVAPALILTGLAYACRVLSRAQLKQVNLRIMLGPRLDMPRYKPILNAYAQYVIARNIRPLALRQMAADRAGGYRVVIATASFAIYVEPIVARLGIGAEDVIATQLDQDASGAIIARIMGSNCYGADKLDHVQRWMAEQGIDRNAVHIRFYSDHVSDAPCLHYADVAIATTPHAPLRAYAADQGWSIIDW